MMAHSGVLVVLAAGMSSRMKASSCDGLTAGQADQANLRPKSLLTFGPQKRPFLDFLLENATEAGYRKVIMVISPQGQLFREYYADGFSDLSLDFATQSLEPGRDKPSGTADAVRQTMDQFPELKQVCFTVCNSDNLYSVKALQTLLHIDDDNAMLNYAVSGLDYPEDRSQRFALTEVDSKEQLLSITEKPDRVPEGEKRVSMNIFKLHGPSLWPFIEGCSLHPTRAEKELPGAVQNFIQANPGQFRAIPIKEHVPDLTSKTDIQILEKWLLQRAGPR